MIPASWFNGFVQSIKLRGSSVADSLGAQTIGAKLLINFIDKKDIVTDGLKL